MSLMTCVLAAICSAVAAFRYLMYRAMRRSAPGELWVRRVLYIALAYAAAAAGLAVGFVPGLVTVAVSGAALWLCLDALKRQLLRQARDV